MTKLPRSSKPVDVPLSSSKQKTPFDWCALLYDDPSLDQKGALEFLYDHLKDGGGAGLLSEQGTGKTIITLALLQRLNLAGNKLLVVPLTAVRVTWGDRVPDASFDVAKFTGGTLIIGYEAFRNNIKRLLRIKWEFAAFDESQQLGNRNSKQSKAARRMRTVVPRRLVLSGTPMDSSPIDLWAQMRFIAPHVLGDVWARPRKRKPGQHGPYFEEEFLRPFGFMNKQREFVPEMMPEFLRRVTPYLYRLESPLEKPEFIPVPVELVGKQLKIYNDMERHGIAHVDGEKIKAGLTITRDLRCFQITGGFVKNEDGEYLEVGRAKQRKLKWLLPQLKRPVVFCRFLPEVQAVKDLLLTEFNRVAVLNGAVKDKRNSQARSTLLRDFQDRKIDALVCQTKTGGVSVEFSSTNELVMYSMGYSFIDLQQIIARFRRHGQTKRVKVWLIVARGTIDEEPLQRIEEKGETVNPIMGHIKEHSMGKDKNDKTAKTEDKAAKKTVAKKAEAKTAKKAVAATSDFKFGVKDIAKALDVTDVTARNKLRDNNVKKAGKSYGWNTKDDMQKVVDKINKAAA